MNHIDHEARMLAQVMVRNAPILEATIKREIRRAHFHERIMRVIACMSVLAMLSGILYWTVVP